MKKLLFAVAALATSLTASAQLWVSGSVGISNQSKWNHDKSITTWNINPAVGYALDDALEVGLELGLDGYSKDEYSIFSFGIAPFARYTFLSEGDFSMFVQGNIEYKTYSAERKKKDFKGHTFGIKFMPGIKYSLTDNFAIVATFGSLYYNHQDRTELEKITLQDYIDDNDQQNGFGCNIFSNLNFGLVYSF